jgi:RNA polymerase sigma-70 factor (ECF subfamily)
VRTGPDHLASLALPAIAHLTHGHYVVLYAVSPIQVTAGDPPAGIVTLEAGASRRSWSGNVLLVVRPGETALLPGPAGPLSGAAMTPESTFDTFQLHAYLESMRAGDRGAADAFLRRVSGRLERLAHDMLRGFPNVRGWADTDDVLQGALLRLLHSLHAIQPESTRHFATLAALHIRRELLDLARHFRNQLNQPGAAPGDQDAEGAGDMADPASDLVDDLDQWCSFHEQVDQLPVEEREVVSLTFYHGWTQRQIADLFGVDERTIRRRWHSAAHKLSKLLGGRLPDA